MLGACVELFYDIKGIVVMPSVYGVIKFAQRKSLPVLKMFENVKKKNLNRQFYFRCT